MFHNMQICLFSVFMSKQVNVADFPQLLMTWKTVSATYKQSSMMRQGQEET